SADDYGRRDAADPALPEPDRQLDQIQADGRESCDPDSRRAQGRRLGIRVPGQRDWHRSCPRRARVRDLPALAPQGRVPRHRYRTSAVQEDRGLSGRTYLGRHGGGSGRGFGIRHYNPVDTSRVGWPGGDYLNATDPGIMIQILLVEDDPGDVLITREAFAENKV